jgi:hypothetical protein
MILRRNKPLYTSERLTQRVQAAVASLKARPGTANVVLPFNELVFTMKDGKPFVPPAIAKGIEVVRKSPPHGYWPDAVLMNVEVGLSLAEYGPRAANVSNSRPVMMRFGSHEGARKSVIEHELMHVAQFVASELIALGQGRSEHKMMYGLPKKKLRTHSGRDESADIATWGHAMSDMEYYPDVHTLAHDHYTSDEIDEGEISLAGFELFTGMMSPARADAFDKAAVEAVRRRVAGAKAAPAKAAPTKVAPASAGLHVKQVSGRFCIYDGASDTGKWASTSEKAQSILAKMRK